MGQVAVAMSKRPQGALSSNTEVNPREQVHAITTRSGVQLPEIHIKRPVAYEEKVPSTDEEHVEQAEQAVDIEESSVTPQMQKVHIGEHMAETEEVILGPQAGAVKWKMRDKPQNMEKKITRFLENDTFDNLDIPSSST
ncbi:Uncharacterized protein Adt_03578 [Abeliophyllum distichum]|uniref:Uncharacterized protein n=1 Tax=Abeliophyllum distichum TaxID=126358 RepID=A0ABD1W283_9LAMI